MFKRLHVEEGRITKAELNTPFAIIAASAEGSGAVASGGPWATVPELLFEKKGLIPALQQLLTSYPNPTGLGSDVNNGHETFHAATNLA